MPEPGLIRMDAYAPNADLVHDALKFPYPIDSFSIDILECSQFLEHIPTTPNDLLWPLLREWARIVKPNGLVIISVPSATCAINAWTNPLHRRGFTPRTFDFLKGRDDSIVWEIGNLPFALEKVSTQRHVQIGGFDSSYHIPKYLKIKLNVGHVRAITFVLRRK